MIDDPTIVMVLVGAGLCGAAIAGWLAYAGWRALQRRTARRRNIAACLAELKREAAWYAVCEYPMAGNDVLHILTAHRLLSARETTALLMAARTQYAEAYGRPAAQPAARPPVFDRALDDEIPF